MNFFSPVLYCNIKYDLLCEDGDDENLTSTGRVFILFHE